MKPKTFVELYKLGCKMTKESEEHLQAYEDLDNLVKFVNEHEKSKELKFSISDERICIVVPYQLYSDKRRQHDGIVDGKKVIYVCPGYEIYISEIIDQMNNTYILSVFRNLRQQISWKLEKLNLALTDWEAYLERYLAPLKSSIDYQEYVACFG